MTKADTKKEVNQINRITIITKTRNDKLNRESMEGDFDVPKLKWYQWVWVVPALIIESILSKFRK